MGLALRIPGMREALFGDELFLYAIATRPGLHTMLQAVHDSESTPPFHFVLAWAATKLGDPTVSVRLPSLLLGTAAIPVTYLAGLRTVGRRAAVLGAAFVALSPFAIFYAVEARAYATLVFLAALSTFSLVRALDTRRRGWLVVYGIAACLILYTHYTGVFLVGAQAAWALITQRDRFRELVIVHVAVALAYLPWLPSFQVQRQDSSANRIASFKSFTPEGFFRELSISLVGHPFEPLKAVPGRLAVVLLAAAAALALGGWLAALWKRPGPAPGGSAAALGSYPGLVAVTALATPIGLALYSAVGENVYIPRNLSASLPGLCLLLAGGLLQLRRPLAAVGALAALAALVVGTVTTLEARYDRPPYRKVADFLDAHAGPRDAVVEYPLFANYSGGTFSFEQSRVNVATLLGHHLDVHFKRPHLFFQTESYGRAAWDPAARERRLFVVSPSDAAHRNPVLPPRLRPRFRLVSKHVWQGLVPVAVFEYEARKAGGRP